MSIFLLWRRLPDSGPGREPERVAAGLQETFSPLFSTPLPARIFQSPAACLVTLELPVPGWKASFFQEDEQTSVQVLNYPINAAAVLTAHGVRASADSCLPALCRGLQEHPRSLLRELSPPFSLIWTCKRTAETLLQNDGLGQAQLFEFQDERLWALSNKILAFRALERRPKGVCSDEGRRDLPGGSR